MRVSEIHPIPAFPKLTGRIPGTLRISGKAFPGIFLSFLLGGVFTGCQPSGKQADAPSLTIAVESSLEQIAAVMAAEYNKISPESVPLTVEIVPGGELIESLDQGLASAVLQWQDPPSGNWSALVGWTGIVFAVHPDNPVENLSSGQAQRIYLGWIELWEEVGGLSGEIHALAYDPEAGWEFIFEGIVLQGNRLVPGARIVPSIAAMSAEIAADALAIGFFPAFHVTAEVRRLTIDFVAAKYPEFLSGEYPFRIPLYLVAKAEVPAEILPFAGWMQSAAGQTVFMQQQ